MAIKPTDYLEAVAALDDTAAYYAVDADQNIISWSAGAEKLLGFSEDEVLGRHCSVAVRCLTCSTGCGVQRYSHIQDKRLNHYHKDGSELTVIKHARALRSDSGEFLGAVEILRPVEPVSPPPAMRRPVNFHGILTGDPHFIAFLTELRQYANTQVNILIRGETGSGKEMVAKAIHAMSPRASKPFVAVNCGTLSREFLASEIFGHKRGAFTGAVSEKVGLLAEAEGGTLFLDEVAELSLEVQAMLLRVLQERRYRPLGSARDQSADVRILSATHVSLRAAVKSGRFREDLMYRLRVLPIFIPPLRDRGTDIAILWQEFTRKAADQHKLTPIITTQSLQAALTAHNWPGNVRELANLAEMIAITRAGKEAGPQHLPPEFRETKPAAPPQKAEQESTQPLGTPQPQRKRRRTPSAEVIAEALEKADGNLEDAAQILGVSRATFWRWRKKINQTAPLD